MTLGENLDTKAFTNTEWTGTKNAVRTFSLRSNSFSSLFGRNISVMKSSPFMALG